MALRTLRKLRCGLYPNFPLYKSVRGSTGGPVDSSLRPNGLDGQGPGRGLGGTIVELR